jgi:hypothetical protein
MSIENLSPSTLRQAADLLEQKADLQKQLEAILNGAPVHTNGERRLSYEGRKAIAQAQLRRWSKFRKGKAKR